MVKKQTENWKSWLKADPTDWLQEDDNPSVRYFTLKDILRKAENDPDLKKAHKEIMTTGIVPRILEEQIQEAVQQGAQELLGRDRRSSEAGIQGIELRRKSPQRLVGHRANDPQRMVRRHTLLGRNVAEHRALVLIVSAHTTKTVPNVSE